MKRRSQRRFRQAGAAVAGAPNGGGGGATATATATPPTGQRSAPAQRTPAPQRRVAAPTPSGEDDGVVAGQRTADQAFEQGIRSLDDLFAAIEERILPEIQAAREVGDEFATLRGQVEEMQTQLRTVTQGAQERAGLPGYDHAEAAADGDPEKKFSLLRAVTGYLHGWRGFPARFPEKDLVHAYTERALEAGVSSAGGFLVAPQWMSDVIELLRPQTVAIQLGARVLPNLTGGPVSFPKMRNGATSFWVAEGKKATKSQPVFGQVNLTPRPLVTIIPVSEDLIDQAFMNPMAMIEEDAAMAMAEALDLGIMKGTGGVGEPLGMVNAPGVGTTSWSGVTYTGASQDVTDKLDEMIFSLAERNALRGRVGWAMHPSAMAKLRRVKDADGKPMLFDAASKAPNMTNGLLDSMMWGYPAGVTTQLTAGATADLIYANWQDVLIGRWGATRVLPSQHANDPTTGENAYLQRQIWVRMDAKVDASLRHGESVEIATSFSAA